MMDLVKKNLVSIISGVVALLAVGALSWPVKGYYDELKNTTETRNGVHRDLTNLLNKKRTWPNVSLKEGAELKPLEMYPTQPVYDKGKELVDQIKSESITMYKTAWEEINKHTELVPGALPNGTSSSDLGRFVSQYTLAVAMNKPDTRMESPLVKRLKAGFLPHPEEINARKNALRQDVFANARKDLQGVVMNQAELEEEYKVREARVQFDLRRIAATKSMIYLNPNSLDPYTPITNAPPGTIPEPAHVWVAQVGYWIQEDIYRALATANEGATNVMDAPVKLLLKVSISGANAFKAVAVGASVPPSANPDPAKKPDQNFLSSITGRYANPLYDVVPFNLLLLVDATQVQNVLQSLSRNNFITVTTCTMESEDISNWEYQGYYMGNHPIVRLNMNCEAMLFREWTAPLMPTAIRRGVGLPDSGQPK